MPISFGPKLGLINNANINEAYYDQFRVFLQALDQLIMGSVINATTVVPPVSPNNGDAYLISSTPSGAWSTFPINSIAVWDTQVTNSGTNTQVPAWVNYAPNAGWIVWNVALSGLYNYTGSAWTPVGGGANFPVNTNITSMTALSTTSSNALTIASASVNSNEAISVTDGIHTSTWSSNGTLSVGGISCGNVNGAVIQAAGGLVSNGLSNATPNTAVSISQAGTNTQTLIIDAPAGLTSSFGAVWQYGPGTFGDATNNMCILQNVSPWPTSSPTYNGIGFGVSSPSATTIVGAGVIQTQTLGTAGINTVTLNATGLCQLGQIRLGPGTGSTPGLITGFAAANQAIKISVQGQSGAGLSSLIIDSGAGSAASGVGLLTFASNYYSQTTVGAAGSASAIPGAPRGWLQFYAPDGTLCVFPYWLHS